MAHMLSLRENGELFERLQNCHVPANLPTQVLPGPISLSKDLVGWMQARAPTITGPHSNRVRVSVLLGYRWDKAADHIKKQRDAHDLQFIAFKCYY